MELNKYLGLPRQQEPLTELEKRILKSMTDEEVKAYMANR